MTEVGQALRPTPAVQPAPVPLQCGDAFRTGADMRQTFFRWAGRAAPFLLLLAAAWVLWREFHGLRLEQVAAEAVAWGPAPLAAAAGLTAASFGLLALIEALGLRWAGVKAPFRTSTLGAFCGNAFAHTLGFALVTGTAIRARLYAPYGASLATVAQVTAFYGVTFGLGMAGLGGLVLALEPGLAAAVLPVSPALARGLGLLLLSGPATYVAACATLRGQVTILGHALSLPPLRTALAQVGLGLVDTAVTAAVAWVLLPHLAVAYQAFVGPYVLATFVGLVSHVPGGAGVFEGVILTLLPEASRSALAAAFLGYRLIYYVVPLTLAAGVLVRTGLAEGTGLARVRRSWAIAAPAVLSVAAFALGALLILTAVGRIAPERLAVLRATVPLLVLETSHLLSLVAGLALMAAALGLMRRRRQAVGVAALAAAVGASTALLRGLDLGPALLTAVFGVALVLSRRAFRRRGAWSDGQWISWWSAGLLAVVTGAAALGLWIYADTPFETHLLADVGYRADPARFLRGLAVLGAALLAAGASVLARAGTAHADVAGDAGIDAVRPLVEACPDTTARLALIGDKALLRAPDDAAFVMYGAQGRSLISMGDPVGDRDAGRRLLWKLKETADRADARLVIYHGTPDWLVDYLDLGLVLLKLGEEAKVPLADFSLVGGRRRNLRQAHARAQRDGLTFELVCAPPSEALLTQLEAISEAWLLAHGGTEKGFSLGRFDPAVLRHDPVALVRHEGRIVAFANVWTGGRVEASVDLMRHVPSHAGGVMDFLFIELMRWARAEGYQRFNLGLAPLAGLNEHPLAPLWHKVGGEVARRGARFYGFQGLRAFKAKFDPVWTPRYLAAPPLALAGALIDVTRLVGREAAPRPSLTPSLTKP
ncbi:bifunctional lysylphosphatidylglycerol flippase/synthetase MprF [Phenylobacterium sp.]|uniref:bifunctional lysylphosphatidylglycerol flippase/synthetase MprF n=1 Tax=Phenylobacterium sp. TaxID=1871053 RepID=UPI0025D0A6DE|nr:bifunctional lysylphosphatidylglycerol flippase/synthetase MprF [Phenylobacterium sp.]MBX3482726.1 bifunctional lysylphosphatidylglycerol flippase/synthetase MprF [Phenylobacterium sp.]